MSRTYSNFLLFEDTLDNIPTTSPTMVQAVNKLLNPITKIVEEDCGTLTGHQAETTWELEGFTEVATGLPLTNARIFTLLGNGQYRTGVRSLHTCLSHTKGGICRTCYSGQYLGQTAPVVGTNLSLPSSLVYQTDVLHGDGYTAEFSLTETSDDWYDVVVVNQGSVVDSSSYTLGYNFLTFNTPPVAGQLGIYVVHFIKRNSDPFLGYIAKTYTGALLGMKPLPSLPTLLRESLYEAVFPDAMVSDIIREVSRYKTIPSTYLEFLERQSSKLEKVLLGLYLYAIYGSLTLVAT